MGIIASTLLRVLNIFSEDSEKARLRRHWYHLLNPYFFFSAGKQEE